MTRESVDELRRLLSQTPPTRLPRLISTHDEDPRPGVQRAVASARARLERHRIEQRRVASLYELERRLHREGYSLVAGVDEVGRGALAGPVTAAAVVLPRLPRIPGLDDSKRLKPDYRELVAQRVASIALSTAVAHVSASEIDAIGIASAVRRAMTLALRNLDVMPDHVVVDGLPVGLARSETAVVKGDATVAAVAAASVIAKVARDSLMCSLAPEYPDYGFDVNKGYGTTEHVKAIFVHGPCVLHRRSFAPCGGTLPLF